MRSCLAARTETKEMTGQPRKEILGPVYFSWICTLLRRRPVLSHGRWTRRGTIRAVAPVHVHGKGNGCSPRMWRSASGRRPRVNAHTLCCNRNSHSLWKPRAAILGFIYLNSPELRCRWLHRLREFTCSRLYHWPSYFSFMIRASDRI